MTRKHKPPHGAGAAPEAAPNSSRVPSPPTGASPDDELVTIARIARPHGIKGEVIADIVTDFPERFEALDQLYISVPGAPLRRSVLEHHRFHQGRVVLKLQDCNSRDEAEKLRLGNVQIPASEIVELPAGSFFEFELIGARVETDTGRSLGKVTDIMRTGAAPLLVITDGESEWLVPLAEEICTRIDPEQQLIVITPPEGLLDL